MGFLDEGVTGARGPIGDTGRDSYEYGDPIGGEYSDSYEGVSMGTGTTSPGVSIGPPSKPPVEGVLEPLGPTSPSTPVPTTATATAPEVALQDLYSTGYDVAVPTSATVSPGAVQQAGVQGATAGTAAATSADASLAGPAQTYEAAEGEVTSDQLASERLAAITAQDSPLMARARQAGIRIASRRGLGNSSIAAGAALGEMVDRATPLAQQEAATFSQQALANQAAANRASEFSAEQQNQIEQLNAQLGTDVSKFNAQQLNQASAINAQLQTAVSQGNAQAYNAAAMQFAQLQATVEMDQANRDLKASLAGAEMTNARNIETMRQNSELNRTYLVGSQQRDLEQMRSQYQNLLQTNQSAALMYSSYFNNIGSMMNNLEMTPERVAVAIETQQRMLDGALSMMDGINSSVGVSATSTPQFQAPSPAPVEVKQGAAVGGVPGPSPARATKVPPNLGRPPRSSPRPSVLPRRGV